MTRTTIVNFNCYLLGIFASGFTISLAVYTGSWCPYQVEKVIPCRVRNGSEPYYGPNICWRNDNGSYACTKKILYRPKYVTTYKKIMETKYKCCPGMEGPNCEKECFNCLSHQRMEERLTAAERRLSRLEKSYTRNGNPGGEKLERSNRDYLNHNNVLPTSSRDFGIEGSPPISYVTMSLRVQNLFDEFKDMQNRIRLLESELTRLNSQVDDITISSNMAYDYGGSNTGEERSHKDKNPILDDNNKDGPTATNHVNEVKDGYGVERQQTSSSSPTSQHPHRHSGKSDHSIRVLEENLERGDIASTLNDDYGDEIYNDNSTEQYADELQLKREHSP